jgi:hypothetical protein
LILLKAEAFLPEILLCLCDDFLDANHKEKKKDKKKQKSQKGKKVVENLSLKTKRPASIPVKTIRRFETV